MASRLSTLVLWALVLASMVFWGLRIFAPRTGVPATAQAPVRSLAMGGEFKRLLGTGAEEGDEDEGLADASDRFQLLGVVAPRGAAFSPMGVALIAVGGEPAKAWRTGSTVDGDTVLLSVGPRSVQLGPRGGPATTELTLPDPETAVSSAPPARGVVSPVTRPPSMGPQGMAPGQPVPQGVPGNYQGAPAAQPIQRAGPADQPDVDDEEE